jgi:hypothetical protein
VVGDIMVRNGLHNVGAPNTLGIIVPEEEQIFLIWFKFLENLLQGLFSKTKVKYILKI